MSKKSLLVESVMHPFPHTVGLDQTLEVANTLMREHNVRHLPVRDGGKLIGMLSDRDIHFAEAVDQLEPKEIKVEDVYTPEPYVVPLKEPVATVARKMAHDRIGCALVVEEGSNNLVGIFTTVDACRTLAEALSGDFDQ